MKKASLFIIMAMLVLMNGLAFAGRSEIVESLDNVSWTEGYEFLAVEVRGQAVATSSYIEFFANNVIGYSSFGVDYIEVSTGNVTTVNVQAIFSTGEALGASQTITAGTDLTVLKSAWYRIRYYNNFGAPTTVTFNFNIAD